jgi:5-methylcytosine-specific restriction endonuclease McrA
MLNVSKNIKNCRDCGLSLSIERFSRNGRKNGYRRPECRKCQHKKSKKNNPNYQRTKGTIEARRMHRLSRAEIDKIKMIKTSKGTIKCIYCTKILTQNSCELDHKIPLAVGGNDDLENLQLLCQRCNREKHSKTHEEYISWLILVSEPNKFSFTKANNKQSKLN